ncbi:MAG: DoxX family protein [Actinomycetes bacterium]|jgi:hypothetical protein
MTIALIVLAGLLGLMTAFSAFGKLSKNARTVDMLHHVGLSDSQIRLLAVIEILGALGLLVGIWIPILGQLAALGFTIYFLGAAIAHARKKDPIKDIAPSLIILILAIIVTILQFAR